MAMEALGGSLVKGRPTAAFAGGKTHVFAIGVGGVMKHWTSVNGTFREGPSILERLGTNIEPSYPCAIADGNALHVFAIGHGGPASAGGPFVHWFSPDGTIFFPPVEHNGFPIPSVGNGIAAAVPNAGSIDAYAVTSAGLTRYRLRNDVGILSAAAVPGSAGAACAPAAISSGINVTDVFMTDAAGSVQRWRTTNDIVWASSILPRPAGASPGPLVQSGFAAVSPESGQIELFAVTRDGWLANWSINGANVIVRVLSAPPRGLNDSVPAAVMVDGRIEVFAIGQPSNPFTGGPLVRWRRDRGSWSQARVIGASLSPGGLGASAANHRVDAFGLAGADLSHWPAGVRGASSNEAWANWANNQRIIPAGHCHPSTEEEVVAIVKTAEELPGARVRAVGSSWSFTDIGVTPSFLVETKELNSILKHVIDPLVLTEHAPDVKYLIHVEAGIKVEDLMVELDGRDLAPFTMGGSSGQTLAGVISTSVHGSNWDRGPIPNSVRAIHLVGPGGIKHWIEPDQWRITKEAVLRARLGPDVQIRYDDDWFDAALVSMGSMGVITSVVLEVTDQYKLEKSCEELKWFALKPRLASGSVFADPYQYAMVAIDPVEMGERTCYLTTHQRSDRDPDGPPAFPGPLEAYCNFDLEKALIYLASAPLAAGVLEGVLAVVTATAGAFGIPLPAGATLLAAIPILVTGLKLAGPGAVADFLGTLLNPSSEVAAALITWITRDALKPGQIFRNIAHKVMAPVDRGECTVRGLAIELAFDTSTGGHLNFIEEAMMLLDQRRKDGKVLGGYIALRFVGPSRAILSPQQSARTCMIEITSIRSLNSTAGLLDELELMGKRHGAIQHWGMHSPLNLKRVDLQRAYPRLDTWRRVRREISNGGAIQTFENAFSNRLELDAAPAGVPIARQEAWRWCRKCMGMAFGAGAPGPCPAGGAHDHGASGNYGFTHNTPSAPGQRNWRWCSKCMGMTLGGGEPGPCSAGGMHDLGSSGEYTILRNGQSSWHACSKCQSLIFVGAGGPSLCPAGGNHTQRGGSNYWLAFPPVFEVEIPSGRGGLPGRRVRVEQPYSSPEIPGQRGWHLCNVCKGLSRVGGTCSGRVSHAHEGSTAYVVLLNAPAAPGQAHWRLCNKCQTLSFSGGACFAGDTHNFYGSGDYTVLDRGGQSQWRYCKNCHGLWFSGSGGQGRCPSPAGVHDLGIDDYFV